MDLLPKIGFYTEILCFLVGCYKIIPHKEMLIPKSFLIILGLSVSVEILLFLNLLKGNNILAFNLLSILNFYYFFYLFYLKLKRELKPFILFSIVSIYSLSLIYSILNTSIHSLFLSFANITGSLLISTLIVVYFLKILQSDKILHLRSDFFFWFCIGGLLYYLGSIPFEAVANTEGKFTETLFVNHLLFLIYYVCLIIGFLSHKSQTEI